MTIHAEFTIYVPITDNHGNSTLDARNKLEKTLLDLFGGFTLDPFEKLGAWKDPESGKLYTDKIVTYSVALDPSRVEGELIPIINDLRKDTHQECIYVKLTSTNIRFV